MEPAEKFLENCSTSNVEDNNNKKSTTKANGFKEWKRNPRELEASLHKEIEADERYQLINDAKLRALAQGTHTYQEFREIWMAAHLRPMEKQDKLDAFLSGPDSKVFWNSIANSKSGDDASGNSKTNTKPIINSNDKEFLIEITSAQAFSKIWKQLKHSDDKFEFLRHQLKVSEKTEPLLPLELLWREEVPSEILSGVVQIILQVLENVNDSLEQCDIEAKNKVLNFAVEKVYDILHILEIASNSRRFGITLIFMSKCEQLNIKTVFSLMEKVVETDYFQKCWELKGAIKSHHKSSGAKQFLDSVIGKFYRLEINIFNNGN